MPSEYIGAGDGSAPDQGFPMRHQALDVCRLVTRGRVSGSLHDIEIWFGLQNGTLYLISGNGPTADWYQNLLAEPVVEVRFGSDARVGLARDVIDPAERRVVGEVMGDKYGGWGGDPDIGLTESDWLWKVPAAAVDRWHQPGEVVPTP